MAQAEKPKAEQVESVVMEGGRREGTRFNQSPEVLASQRQLEHNRRVVERFNRMKRRARMEGVKDLVAKTFAEYQRRAEIDRILGSNRGGMVREVGKAAATAFLMKWLENGKKGESRMGDLKKNMLKVDEVIRKKKNIRLREMGRADGGKHEALARAVLQRDLWNRRINQLMKEYK